MTAHIITNVVVQTRQRPSVVVVGNGPTYNPATDAPRARQARVFSVPSTVVVTRSWLVAPFGTTSTNSDIFKGQDTYGWPPPVPEWSPAQKGTLNTLQRLSACDIFKGQDTYGWPPPPVPEYWCPPQTGTLNAITHVYSPATDVRRSRQARVFSAPAVIVVTKTW